MFCLWCNCINDRLDIVTRGIKSSLVHLIFQSIDGCNLQRLDFTFHSLYLWHKKSMWRDASKSGVSFLIFQGWDICASRIIPLGMSLIGDTRKGNFSWSMDFNLSWWKKIVANQKIFKWFVLADMEVYLGRRVSKKWLICLLLSSFLISHSSVKSKYGGETEN